MDALSQRLDSRFSRRGLLKGMGVGALQALLGAGKAMGNEKIQLPFANGERELVQYPQKRPLIRLTSRPPQLETPFSVFNTGVITPNDAFFVRYHLADIPLEIDPLAYRLKVSGKVKNALDLSLSSLRSDFEPSEVVAVNQCSGNSRGFFNPRVPGGQLGNGAMGNARWKGVRLKDLLDRAGVAAGARQVLFDGLDRPVAAGTPDYIKALSVDHALDGEVLVAYQMNGEELPMLNGYPLRLVVPGHYGTYWVKHLSEISVVDDAYTGFWMGTAYRIPDTVGACVEPGTAAKTTVPISRFNVRSFLTSLSDGSVLQAGREERLRGIAFDGGAGIREVLVSSDGARSWEAAALGEDLGRYSFREWHLPLKPVRPGQLELLVKATNRLGESQPMEALWNPAGYMRNVVERTRVDVLA
jgi:DMSO/TMAO reductase YedYZ molybdopterin-dependent catalytic subunit